MSRRFCTYFDSRYLPKGLAMYHSLRKYLGEVELWVLCLDEKAREVLAKLRLPGIKLLTLPELEAADPELAARKSERRLVEYYFTSTPCFTRYVMRAEPAPEWTTYLDADLYFFSSPEAIFEEMKAGDVGIIAHRFGEKQKHLETYGVYNVGWVSFRNTEPGRQCLDWWRDRCLEWCRDTPEDGKFADQKYLDRFAEVTPSTISIQHPGANLAPWNVGNHQVASREGHLTVDGRDLIFYHFHDCRQTGPRVFNPGLRKYGFKVTPVLREHVYPPYLRRLLELKNSTSNEGIRFDGVAKDETPVPEKDLIVVPPTRWEAWRERVSSWLGRPAFAAIIVILLIAASALYAFPWSRKKDGHSKNSAHRQKPTEALVQLLAAKPLPVPDNFIAAASGLSEHLAKMDIKLTVALLPEREAVSQEAAGHPDGLPQSAWTKSGALLAGAEARLKEAHVPVCNLLPLLHDDFVRHPASPPYRDPVHLTHLGIASIGRGFASWAGWRSDAKEASHAMWLGDCNTTFIRHFQEERGYGKPVVCWRNGSANQMAHEASLLKKSDFAEVREVVWLVSSEYLSGSIFPPVASGEPPVAEGEKSCVVTIRKTSRLPQDLGPGSPYPDAIAVIQFAADDGSVLMGLISAMHQHVVNEAVRQWGEGSRFRLKLISWDLACAQTPELKNLRQLDDQTDFTAPRYWIAEWQRLD